jgi:hypothetical protein
MDDHEDRRFTGSGGREGSDEPEVRPGPPESDVSPPDDGARRAAAERKALRKNPDVFLDAPRVSVEEIDLEVDHLRARVSLSARVANLVDLDVGADVAIDGVKLDIKGVEAQALLEVRLQRVLGIIERALASIDRHPELLSRLAGTAGSLVGAAGQAATGAARAVGDLPVAQQLGAVAGGAVGRNPEAPGDGPRDPRGSGDGPPTGRGQLLDSRGRVLERAAGDLLGPVLGEATAPRTPDARESTRSPERPELAPPEPPAPERPPTGGPEARVTTRSPEMPERAPQESPPPETPAPGDREATETHRLFDGSDESAAGWRHVGGGELRREDDALIVAAGSELGLAYFAPLRFGDFRLVLDFHRVEPGVEAALALRFRDPAEPVPDRERPEVLYPYDNPAYVAAHTGVEIPLGPGRRGSGAAGESGSLPAEREPGGTLRLEVEVRGDSYSVRGEGGETTRFENSDVYCGRSAETDPRAGFVGLLVRHGALEVRHVELEAWTPARPARGKKMETAEVPVAMSGAEASAGAPS